MGSIAPLARSPPLQPVPVLISVTFDPEGALGWISAAWMTWLGLQAGRVFLLARGRPLAERDALRVPMIARWILWGTVLGLLGGGLAGFSENGGFIPLNKNLWSPSFVLALAGVSYGALAAFFVTIDVFRSWSGAPFRYPGMNSVSTRCGACMCLLTLVGVGGRLFICSFSALQIAIYILASFRHTCAASTTTLSHAVATVACALFVAFFVAVARCMYF